MLTAIFILLFVIALAYWFQNGNGAEVITEVFHHEPHHDITGNIKRQFENDQAFVVDPVDQKKIFVNSNDDMYEDANGKVWRLYS